MRRSIGKSAKILATLSVVSGVVGTSTLSYAGPKYVYTGPTFPIQVPVPKVAQDRIDQIDANLRAEFPVKRTDAERDKSLAIYGGETAILAGIAIYMSKYGKSTDARILAEYTTVTQRVGQRLPDLNSQIDVLSRDIEIDQAKSTAMKERLSGTLTNPKGAVTALSAKLTEERAEVKALLAQREADLKGLTKMETSGQAYLQGAPVKTATPKVSLEKPATPVVETTVQPVVEQPVAAVVSKDAPQTKQFMADMANHRKGITEQVTRLKTQLAAIDTDLAEMKTTGTLPASILETNNVNAYGELQQKLTRAQDALNNLNAERVTITVEANAVAKKLKIRNGFGRPLARKALRVLGVVGPIIMIGDRANAYYVSYVLGQEPTIIPSVDMARTAAPHVKQFVKDSAEFISGFYEDQVKPAAQNAKDAAIDAKDAAVEQYENLRSK